MFTWIEGRLGKGVPLLIGEGLFRVLLFVGYLWLIGRTKDIHRVFEYHGAEHKTIAAFEHGDDLVPEKVDRYPKEHVRCGTNFLIIVMIITIFVFTLFGTPGFLWRIVSRIVAIPIIAGFAYEALRLGARFQRLARDARAHGARASGCRRSRPSSPTTPRSRWRSRRSARSCAARRKPPAPPDDDCIGPSGSARCTGWPARPPAGRVNRGVFG